MDLQELGAWAAVPQEHTQPLVLVLEAYRTILVSWETTSLEGHDALIPFVVVVGGGGVA